MFTWQESSAGARRALTGRAGGVSTGPWSGLNLGAHVGDEPAAVAENRRRLEAAVGLPVVYMDQCHGAQVAVVDTPPRTSPACDALVTASPGLALAVLVADCVPVLLSSPEGVVAAVHAGRPGLLAGVVPAALAAMRDLGATAVDAVLGPSVCGRCYEVPEAMREEVATVHPVSAAVTWTGTPALDVAAGVVEQLRGLGAAVRWLPGCTKESPGLYSYRAARRTGRFAGVVHAVAQ